MGKQAQTDSLGDGHTGWEVRFMTMLIYRQRGIRFHWIIMDVLYGGSRSPGVILFHRALGHPSAFDWFGRSSEKKSGKLAVLPHATETRRRGMMPIMQSRQHYFHIHTTKDTGTHWESMYIGAFYTLLKGFFKFTSRKMVKGTSIARMKHWYLHPFAARDCWDDH